MPEQRRGEMFVVLRYLVALFMLIMAGMTILAVVNFLPLFEAVPVSPTEGSEQQ